MSDEACCAHRRVSYRTEEVDHDFGPRRDDLKVDPNDPNICPFGIQRVTRGWWECDSGCGARFTVVPRVYSACRKCGVEVTDEAMAIVSPLCEPCSLRAELELLRAEVARLSFSLSEARSDSELLDWFDCHSTVKREGGRYWLDNTVSLVLEDETCAIRQFVDADPDQPPYGVPVRGILRAARGVD